MAKGTVAGWESYYNEGYEHGEREGRREAYELVIAAFQLEKTYEGKLNDFERDLKFARGYRAQDAARARLGDATPFTTAPTKTVRITEPANVVLGEN